MATLLERFRAIEAALDGPDRFKDFRFDLLGLDKQPVLAAGGKWDRTFARFLDPATEGDAGSRAVYELQESQLEFATWAAEWLCDFRENRRGTPSREVQVAMMAGKRRGGKTEVGVAFVCAVCVDVPIAPSRKTPLIAWIVCKSYRERFEIEQWIIHHLPATWYHHRKAPDHEFHFQHGPILRLLSADDDAATKQGRVDIALINEPQKMGARAVANAVLGASDLGGLVILAANPPGDDGRGSWMFDLKDALNDEAVALARGTLTEPLGVRYFHLDSAKNKAIDQISRRKAGKIAVIIDPGLAAGDVDGEWRRPQPRAAWEFEKHVHLQALPQVGAPTDITSQIAKARGAWGEWLAVAGADFQHKPHIVSTIWRVFGTLDDPTFWAVGELAGERQWTEEQYLDVFAETFPELTSRNLLWVGDASGSWQNSAHSNERTSFEVFKDPKRGWKIIPPQDPKSDDPDARARNPFVDDQLQLVNELLRRKRLFVDPVRCPWLGECFLQAITKRGDAGRRRIVQNKHAHALSSALYVLWRLASRTTKPGGLPPKGAMPRLPLRRPGVGLFST